MVFVLFCLTACNIGVPTRTAVPLATPALPRVEILFPAHNQQVVEGVIFDIEILASDATTGIEQVELFVDEQLQQTSESGAGGLAHYRVTMNWFAQGIGWHKFAAVAYRADGTASHPHIIALEVVPPG